MVGIVTLLGGAEGIMQKKMISELVLFDVLVLKAVTELAKEVVTFKPYVKQQKGLADNMANSKAIINVQMPKQFGKQCAELVEKAIDKSQLVES